MAKKKDKAPAVKRRKLKKILAFVEEYVALCDKHGVMIFSEGEELQVGEVHPGNRSHDDLWGVRSIAKGEWEPFFGHAIKKKYG